MTKKEILACKDTNAIWSAMQENPELKADREVWNHMTSLSTQKEWALVQKFFQSDKVDMLAHIDYLPKD